MKQIRAINCICQDSEKTMEKKYVGEFSFDQMGIMEGFLIDTTTNRKFLTFGYYKQGEMMSLIKGICDSEEEYPKEMIVKRKANSYQGEVSIKASFIDFPIGSCELQGIDIAKTKKEQREELSKLERRISLLKNNMNKKTEDLYTKCMPSQEKEKIFQLLRV